MHTYFWSTPRCQRFSGSPGCLVLWLPLLTSLQSRTSTSSSTRCRGSTSSSPLPATRESSNSGVTRAVTRPARRSLCRGLGQAHHRKASDRLKPLIPLHLRPQRRHWNRKGWMKPHARAKVSRWRNHRGTFRKWKKRNLRDMTMVHPLFVSQKTLPERDHGCWSANSYFHLWVNVFFRDYDSAQRLYVLPSFR